MIVILIIALPVCVELAGWLVDATFVETCLPTQEPLRFTAIRPAFRPELQST
jgi:hypothetical protein